MAEQEYLAFESDGEVYDVTMTPKSPSLSTNEDEEFEEYGIQEDVLTQMQKTRQMIRTCAVQTVSAFRNFGVANVQEVNLKFGVKLGGKAGLPYITEGSAESNLEITVKCTFVETESTTKPA